MVVEPITGLAVAATPKEADQLPVTNGLSSTALYLSGPKVPKGRFSALVEALELIFIRIYLELFGHSPCGLKILSVVSNLMY